MVTVRPVGTGHNDSFVYQARAFLDEVAGRDELPRNASLADGLHSLLVEEAVVRAATRDNRTPITTQPPTVGPRTQPRLELPRRGHPFRANSRNGRSDP
jgi:hypothetical protein